MSEGLRIDVQAWSGNVRPWQARVYLDGKYIGSTGFCKTEARARQAAQGLIRDWKTSTAAKEPGS